ncbi:MAG: hypothetical protein KGR26_09165, partial [Cyanobacteria bacterium REEB65]|nr:hypothetical protein [Cyanobacteria bacterium REEB65]
MNKTVIAATAWLAMIVPAEAITPLDLVGQVQAHAGTVSFEGHRVQLLTRQTMSLKAALQVNYRDRANYRVTIEQPAKLANVELWLHDSAVNIYFPDENLYFHNDNESGSTEFAATILGQITANSDLLFRNYDLTVYSDEQVRTLGLNSTVVGRPCYVLEVTPKGQVNYT